MYLTNIPYLNMCKLNKNRELRWEIERLVVCVFVLLVNYVDNKKHLRPFYNIFKIRVYSLPMVPRVL
jgi:hypothetical protein